MGVIGVGIPWLCCGEEWNFPLFFFIEGNGGFVKNIIIIKNTNTAFIEKIKVIPILK
jgi:hypothetical protein